MTASINIKGLKELQAALNQLPGKIQKNAMRSALRAGAVVLRAEALQRVPVGDPSSEGQRLYGGYRGALRDSVRVTTRSVRGVLQARVVVGGRGKNGADLFYAHFVEFGTAAHVITAKPGGYLAFGGGKYRQVMHPGTRPQPFMRPALDAGADRATRAVADKLRSILATKHGIDVPAPFEEGDE